MTDTQQSATGAITTPKVTLAEALAIHNASHPHSPLIDVTAQIEAAATVRLEALLTKHWGVSEKARTALREIGTGSTPHHRYMWLMITASIFLAFGARPDTTERSRLALDGPFTTPEVIADRRRLCRAYDKLKSALWTGVHRRGEA